jgi:hypothetical protein
VIRRLFTAGDFLISSSIPGSFPHMDASLFHGEIQNFISAIARHAEKHPATVIFALKVTLIRAEQQFPAERNYIDDIYSTLFHSSSIRNILLRKAIVVPDQIHLVESRFAVFQVRGVSNRVLIGKNFDTSARKLEQ